MSFLSLGPAIADDSDFQSLAVTQQPLAVELVLAVQHEVTAPNRRACSRATAGTLDRVYAELPQKLIHG